MAKKTKRYYWLKLKENFFDEDTIEWLEEQENGRDYCLFYLKLCLKSLKSDGVLVRKVGDVLIPYDIKKIAETTRTEENIASEALELLKQIGYIQLLDSGGLFLTQVQYMTGSETDSASRVRKHREEKALQSNTDVTNMKRSGNTEKEIENRDRDKSLELDIEIEKDIDFNYFWSIYPRQVQKDSAYNEWVYITNTLKVDKLELIQAARNYSEDVKDFAQKFIKYPKNFLSDKVYIDYMTSNYQPRPKNVIPISKPVNKFNDFPQRNYTKEEFKDMERKLINRQ